MDGTSITLIVLAILLLIFLIYAFSVSVHFLKEKEVKVIERLGCYHRTLPPGVHFIIPFIDRPKLYTHRYYVSNPSNGKTTLVVKKDQDRISTWNEVLDFPKQAVITRDNARIHLDAILQYRIQNPVKMIYQTQNLPLMLSKKSSSPDSEHRWIDGC